MNIAADVARGLEYLHGKGVVCCYLRSSDVPLGVGDGYHYPKLSQYELAKDGQLLDGIREARDFPCTIAPETAMCGKVCRSSDVYSFGVVLLEIFTGRRAIADQAAGAGEDPSIVRWVILHKFCCSLLILTWPSGFRDVIDVMSAAESGSAILQIRDAAPPDG
jgi:serine/threonine protein kinase